MIWVLALCAAAYGERVQRKADAFYTVVYLDSGDTLEFTLINGSGRQLVLKESGVETLAGWTLWADVEVDGHDYHLIYSPFTMKAQSDPKIINGMRVGLDGVKGLPDLVDERADWSGFSEGADPPKDVRLWVNDATRPIAPNCHLMMDLAQELPRPPGPRFPKRWDGEWPVFPKVKDYRIRQDRDVHKSGYELSTERKTNWLGVWSYGLHLGTDYALPDSSRLYAAFNDVEMVQSPDPLDPDYPRKDRLGYKLERDNGDVYWVGIAHCIPELLIPEGTKAKAGDWFARSSNVEAGIPHAHVNFWLEDHHTQSVMKLNVWPVIWQGLENRKAQDGFIQAEIDLAGPADVGEPVQFTASQSQGGFGHAIQSYRWYFSNGQMSGESEVMASFEKPGLYQAVLVIDDGYLQDYAEVHFTVGPGSTEMNPKIHQGISAEPALPHVDESVSFNIQAKTRTGHPPEVCWYIDDDVKYGNPVGHVFREPGRHVVIARVRDENSGRMMMDAYCHDTWEWIDASIYSREVK